MSAQSIGGAGPFSAWSLLSAFRPLSSVAHACKWTQYFKKSNTNKPTVCGVAISYENLKNLCRCIKTNGKIFISTETFWFIKLIDQTYYLRKYNWSMHRNHFHPMAEADIFYNSIFNLKQLCTQEITTYLVPSPQMVYHTQSTKDRSNDDLLYQQWLHTVSNLNMKVIY